MTDVAKALRESEIADVAAYYAGQPQRNPNPVTLAPVGRRSCSSSSWGILAVIFRPARHAIAWIRGTHRNADFGRARHEYLVKQLQLYASGERRNDVYARMRTIAARLTPAEIEGLSAYYRAGFR